MSRQLVCVTQRGKVDEKKRRQNLKFSKIAPKKKSKIGEHTQKLG